MSVPETRSPEPRRVMAVEDNPTFGRLLNLQLQREGYAIHLFTSGEEALAKLTEVEPDIVLMDVKLPGKDGCTLLGEIHAFRPDLPIVMMTGSGTVEMAVDCMKRGAYDFLTKPFDFVRLQAILRNAMKYRDLNARVQALEGALVTVHGFDQIVAHSPNMLRVVDLARRAATRESDVLILGESGSGKEVLARAIHFNSTRKKGPFVAINCGAIPETLLESELFGHEKGAFTGATGRRAGCFEQAHTGTLFLDEIGEMRPDMQVRLLRALENREIRRVGGERTINVNVRIISSTNQNITERLKIGAFRGDLYYRLAVLVLELPPLRERFGDILPLAQHFLDEARRDGHTRASGFSQETVRILMKHSWPGNVRELRNVLERAIVFEEGPVISAASLPPELLKCTLSPSDLEALMTGKPKTLATEAAESTPPPVPSPVRETERGDSLVREAPPQSTVAVGGLGEASWSSEAPPDHAGGVLPLDEEEERIILRALAITGGNISDAARRLGVHRSTLHRKMTRYGLATDESLAAGPLPQNEV